MVKPRSIEPRLETKQRPHFVLQRCVPRVIAIDKLGDRTWTPIDVDWEAAKAACDPTPSSDPKTTARDFANPEPEDSGLKPLPQHEPEDSGLKPLPQHEPEDSGLKPLPQPEPAPAP